MLNALVSALSEIVCIETCGGTPSGVGTNSQPILG